MTDSTEVTLEPRPFCNGEARLGNFVIEAAIRCTDCDAHVSRYHASDRDSGITKAAEAWNHRASTAQLEAQIAAMREQGQREGKAAVCAWLRHFTAIKPASEGAEKVAQLADVFEQSEQAYDALATSERAG